MQATTDSNALHARTRAGFTAGDPAGTLWRLLRIAAAMCFIGHGAFGIIGKAEWLPYFATFGIPADAAWTLMPIIGAVDITVGVLALVSPSRPVFFYMAVWALWTAALRPLTGESVFEMLERAGNYGVPIALLVLAGRASKTRELAGKMSRALHPRLVLAWTTALLLFGHGALAAIERKPLLVTHVEAIGLPAWTAFAGGWLEIVLALIVLARPSAGMLIGVAVWKLATEMLYPIAGAPVWEVIERGGSYGAPLGLALLVWYRSAAARRSRHVDSEPRVASPQPAFREAGQREASVGNDRSGRHLAAAALLAGLSLAGPASAALAQQAERPVEARVSTLLEGAELVDALRRGGLVLAFRHTETDDGRDTGPAREQQRNLTPKGEEDARLIGEAIRQLGIPIGEVRASWMYRTRESAELAFGRVQIDSTLRGRGSVDGLRRGMVTPVARGTNRVLLSHNGVFHTVLEGHGLARMAEGDIVIVEPLGDGGFRPIGHLKASEWAGLRKSAR